MYASGEVFITQIFLRSSKKNICHIGAKSYNSIMSDNLDVHTIDSPYRPIKGLVAMAGLFDRHPNTIRNWIKRHDFPAGKLPNGEWITSPPLVDQWIASRIPTAEETANRKH